MAVVHMDVSPLLHSEKVNCEMEPEWGYNFTDTLADNYVAIAPVPISFILFSILFIQLCIASNAWIKLQHSTIDE